MLSLKLLSNVPMMGWNETKIQPSKPLWSGLIVNLISIIFCLETKVLPKWMRSAVFYACMTWCESALSLWNFISDLNCNRSCFWEKNSVWKTSNSQCYHLCSVIIFFLCCMMKWFLRKRSLSLFSRKSHQRSGYTNSRMTCTFSPDFMQYCSSVPNEVG